MVEEKKKKKKKKKKKNTLAVNAPAFRTMLRELRSLAVMPPGVLPSSETDVLNRREPFSLYLLCAAPRAHDARARNARKKETKRIFEKRNFVFCFFFTICHFLRKLNRGGGGDPFQNKLFKCCCTWRQPVNAREKL